jgi:hypothetical protein
MWTGAQCALRLPAKRAGRKLRRRGIHRIARWSEVALARKRTPGNGSQRLEEAMALLIQNQASLLERLSETDQRFARMDERSARSDERFARIEERMDERFARIDQRFERIDQRFERLEADLAAILQVLAEHSRILERLPDAVREKIGFKPQPQEERRT